MYLSKGYLQTPKFLKFTHHVVQMCVLAHKCFASNPR